MGAFEFAGLKRLVERPQSLIGNEAWAYMVHKEPHSFCVVVGHNENGVFEVWVNGSEQERGLSAVAKVLSLDLQTQNRDWICQKLTALEETKANEVFDLVMPGGKVVRSPSVVNALARVVRYRLDQVETLQSLPFDGELYFSNHDPKTDPKGIPGWIVDIKNDRSGDSFLLSIKEWECEGQPRPMSFWLSGEYPRSLDGLCKLLSMDARVRDLGWIFQKLRSLTSVSEPLGDLFAINPWTDKQQRYPSTVAYLANLILYRYQVLGLLEPYGVIGGQS